MKLSETKDKKIPTIEKSLTINRWHKIVKRLIDYRKKLLEELDLMTNVKSVGVIRGAEVPSTHTMEELRDKLIEIEELVDFIVVIRNFISSANHTTGINDLLSKVEAMSFKLRMLESIQMKMKSYSQMYDLKTANEIKQIIKNLSPQMETRMIDTKLEILNAEDEKKLFSILETWRLERDSIMDDISDRNRYVVTINVPAPFQKFVQ